MNPLIKENLWRKSENNVEFCSKKQGKWHLLMQELMQNNKKTPKEPVAVSYK